MASSFNCTVRSLEDELTQLILNGQISARIDSQKKVGSITGYVPPPFTGFSKKKKRLVRANFLFINKILSISLYTVNKSMSYYLFCQKKVIVYF